MSTTDNKSSSIAFQAIIDRAQTLLDQACDHLAKHLEANEGDVSALLRPGPARDAIQPLISLDLFVDTPCERCAKAEARLGMNVPLP